MAIPNENPYDFSNAVTDRDMLAGRTELIREVSYYLGQARAKPQPVNLAILGQRASGKTSVLNVIGAMAKERGFLLARFDLDSSDVATPLVFFHRLLHEVFTAALSSGAYGGQAGAIATAYGADVWPSMANDLGYIFLAGRDLAKSVAVLNRAIMSSDGDDITQALATYNLAITVAHRGEFSEALRLLDKALPIAQGLDEQDRQMLCLIVGSLVDGRLRFNEIQKPDLVVAIRDSAAAIAKAQESVDPG